MKTQKGKSGTGADFPLGNQLPSPIFRLPAEWEPHAATWIAWPHRRATFLGPFEAIPPVYERLARLIARMRNIS